MSNIGFDDEPMNGVLPDEDDATENDTMLDGVRAKLRRLDDAGKDDGDLPVENDPWV